MPVLPFIEDNEENVVSIIRLAGEAERVHLPVLRGNAEAEPAGVVLLEA